MRPYSSYKWADGLPSLTHKGRFINVLYMKVLRGFSGDMHYIFQVCETFLRLPMTPKIIFTIIQGITMAWMWLVSLSFATYLLMSSSRLRKEEKMRDGQKWDPSPSVGETQEARKSQSGATACPGICRTLSGANACPKQMRHRSALVKNLCLFKKSHTYYRLLYEPCNP